MSIPKFEADFFELPDGSITVVIRQRWPSADDVVEVLRRSTRRGPRRVEDFREHRIPVTISEHVGTRWPDEADPSTSEIVERMGRFRAGKE